MSPEVKSRIIRMAWEDRTTFEEIEHKMGVCESEVIKIMRRELSSKGFRRWRARVSGRVTKHRKLFSSRKSCRGALRWHDED